MKVLLAKNAGFCFGVKRAVEIAISSAQIKKYVYTYGELIHNNHVIDTLKKLNINIIHDLDEIQDPVNTAVIIRSHGAPKSVFDRLNDMGVEIINATCPYVERIHQKIQNSNKNVIIIGEKEHPEVIGSKGYAGSDCFVVNSVEDVSMIEGSENPLIIAQTTITHEKWLDVTQAIKANENIINPEFYNSICDTTKKRQDEAEELAKNSTACIVVGDKKSSNSKKLFEICKKNCKNTYFIDNISEVSLEKIFFGDIISVIAGASTPDWLIMEVTTLMSEQEKVQGETLDKQNAITEEPVSESEMISTEEPETADIDSPAEDEIPVPVKEEIKQGEKSVDSEPKNEELTNENDENDFQTQLDKSYVRLKRGQIVKGKVVQISEEEACVSIGYKSDGILTKAELTIDGEKNPKDILNIGDEIDVEVLTFNDGKGNVLLSMKRMEAKLKWQEFCDDINEENIYDCKVTGVVKGGLLGKTQGYETFIPASQVAMRYVEDLNEYKGQILKVIIKETDRRQKRLVASHRDVLVAEAERKDAELFNSFNKGDTVTGKVKRITDFGAFVDVGGVDGLLHVRDLSWVPIKHPSEVVKVGEEIEVLIINVSPEKKRISLGYKQLKQRPWDMAPEKYLVGSDIEAKVVRIVPFGAFVELEPGIDGLIHISQVATRRLERVEDELKIGDIVRVRVLELDAQKKKISLSRRVLLEEDIKANQPETKEEENMPEEKYEIPEVEELGVTIGDFFPKEHIEE